MIWFITSFTIFISVLFFLSRKRNKEEIEEKTEIWRKRVANFNLSEFLQNISGKIMKHLPFLPNYFFYFLVTLVFIRDQLVEFTKFFYWPITLTFIFYSALFFILHSWITYFLMFGNVILYIFLANLIFLFVCFCYGHLILNYFPKVTRKAIEGHFLETALTSYYNEPLHTDFKIPYYSIQKFFNEWEVENKHIKNESRYHESSLLFYFETIEKEINKTSPETQKYFHDAKVKFIKENKKWDEIKPFIDWFPLHLNCNLEMYNDSIEAFKDIYDAISKAKIFIYITGWSLNPNLLLIRDNEKRMTLGELLIERANAGVVVNLLLWKETGSKFQSNLDTGDITTEKYFKDTKVQVKLNRRSGYSGLLFSHHQKTVILDTKYDEHDSIMAFIGGLDLTTGRYDSQDHPLFSTLLSTHKNDIFQTVPLENENLGPRLPWHDIHSKVEGGIAFDLLQNFEDRWLKFYKKEHLCTKIPLFRKRFRDNGFQIQLFRSIDSDSINGDLTYNVYPRIEQLYYESIKKAEKYIYIENQYFCGSGFLFTSDLNKRIKNRIPLALLEKIIEKIQKKEEFKCLIVIPMYPAGTSPEGSVTQEQLFWQWKTMEMLYTRIADAIEKYGSKSFPSDYLRFYCLGTREDYSDPNLEKFNSIINKDCVQLQLLKSKRSMIYVHSKMMIIDDEFIVIGSANLNERSLAGNGDTEICIGASEMSNSTKIKDFRKKLFKEHISKDENFDNVVESFQKINEIADENWKTFSQDEFCVMKSHLMSYPIVIQKNGQILEKVKYFPDSKAFIKGMDSFLTPDVLTI